MAVLLHLLAMSADAGGGSDEGDMLGCSWYGGGDFMD